MNEKLTYRTESKSCSQIGILDQVTTIAVEFFEINSADCLLLHAEMLHLCTEF